MLSSQVLVVALGFAPVDTLGVLSEVYVVQLLWFH